jgi:hypothetical protein
MVADTDTVVKAVDPEDITVDVEGAKGRQIFQVIQIQDADIEVAVIPPIQKVIPPVPLRQHHVAVH